MSKLILILAVLMPLQAFAQCKMNEDVEWPSGDSEQVNVCAYMIPISEIDADKCKSDPEAENCDMVNEVTDVRHTCEINPDQVGCQFYKIEPSGGE